MLQLLNGEELCCFLVVSCDSKLKILVFWTAEWTKQATWSHRLGLNDGIVITFSWLKKHWACNNWQLLVRMHFCKYIKYKKTSLNKHWIWILALKCNNASTKIFAVYLNKNNTDVVIQSELHINGAIGGFLPHVHISKCLQASKPQIAPDAPARDQHVCNCLCARIKSRQIVKHFVYRCK